jgi:hypothetical protein
MTAQLQAPAIGYRGFKWDGSGPLRSTGVEATWPISREPQRAKCIARRLEEELAPEEQHDAPREDCTCGLYAYSKPESVAVNAVGAVVLGYDDLIVHPDGWRAATVEIVALVYSSNPLISGNSRWLINAPIEAPSRDALAMLAAAYGRPLVDDWEHGTALAQEQGAQPIPEILHAEAEAWALLHQATWTMTLGFNIKGIAEAVERMSQEIRAHSVSLQSGYSLIPKPGPNPEPKRKEHRFDTPRQRHAAFNAELARRARPRAAR